MAKFSDERVRAIISQVREFRVVEFPGHPDIKLAVRVLGDDEYDGCRIEAQRKLWKIGGERSWDPVKVSELDPYLFERFVEREVVLRAYFDHETTSGENPVPFFASESDLSKVGSVVVQDLMQMYLEHQEWVNPTISLSEEEAEELCDSLGKGQAFGAALVAIEPSSLRRLLITMAKRLSNSATGKSSST